LVRFWLGQTAKPAQAGLTRAPSAEAPEITIAFCSAPPRGSLGWLAACGSASTQYDVRWLQLCINWVALAHPSGAGLVTGRGIFAAFA